MNISDNAQRKNWIISKVIETIKQEKSFEQINREVAELLSNILDSKTQISVRININGKEFRNTNFIETGISEKQTMHFSDQSDGYLELFYSGEKLEMRQRTGVGVDFNLLNTITHLLVGHISRFKLEKLFLENKKSLKEGTVATQMYSKLLDENTERVKELRAINKTSELIAEEKPVEQTLVEIANLLPKSWQYPKYTQVKIYFEGHEYTSHGFRETIWSQKENFVTIDNKKGYIQIVYTKVFPKEFEGPFLKEERNLLNNLAKLISGYLNNYKGREILEKNLFQLKQPENTEDYKKSLITNKKPLQLFFNQQVIDKYIYLDMMKYKVREILFVATLYDAFILENEDNLFAQFMGDIYHYSLFSRPRITGVTTPDEALEILTVKSFDIVILMVGLDKELPLALSSRIKQQVPSIPVYLLLNQKSQIKYYEELVANTRSLDKLFVWSGDSQIIFAIVKSVEDNANVSNDTEVGLVRVILLVEDSPLYYSKYLQFLYSIVFGQVQQLLPEVEKNEIDKICKMRSRPKILHAKNYEDAMHLFTQYKDYLLCVISDVEFERAGSLDKSAGLKFIKYVKSHILNLPIILQSSENKNKELADKLQVQYMNKNSETLFADLKLHLTSYIGFGDFVFRDKSGKEIATARSIKEFEHYLEIIPDESFFVHAQENQLSIWLMARGEIQLAKMLNPFKIDHINEVPQARKMILNLLKRHQQEKKKGKILDFDDFNNFDNKNIITLSNGSFGGKGRGLAFINTLIYNLETTQFANRINISAAKTFVIGTDEFDLFLTKNNLYEKITNNENSYEYIKEEFLKGKLSEDLRLKIVEFLKIIHRPIAVRSSSLSEDSYTQPFAGVFHTYIIPNNSENVDLILSKIEQTIKLVFVSIYTKEARGYFKAIHHRIEDEKMAVILQELVGQKYEDYYYPHISGTACSYNFYPVSHMQPDEGFAMAAFGLGTYVVEGMSSFRFSPKYPNLDMYTNKDMLESSQTKFFAVDCRKNDVDYSKEGELASLRLLDISEAERQDTLKFCASVYDPQNDRIVPGLKVSGPRILNFANILKYNYIPLAETLEMLLNTIKEALGSPVEIEYAVDLSKGENGLPTFYLLQIKPMVESHKETSFKKEDYEKSDIVLYSKTSIGNKVVNNLFDVVYVDPGKFDKLKTMEMVNEIEYLNSILARQNRPYILIGPGRWGTRDRFLGIPVNWSQISGAQIIVETSLDNFPLDSSLGSHFFHNVTSMNIGYLSVSDKSAEEFIDWEKLNNGILQNETNFCRHIRFEKALKVIINGKKKESIILQV